MVVVFAIIVVIFSVIMLIVTTNQNRNSAKQQAETMGDRLNELKDPTEKKETEAETKKVCPSCSGTLLHEGTVFVCESCGMAYKESEL